MKNSFGMLLLLEVYKFFILWKASCAAIAPSFTAVTTCRKCFCLTSPAPYKRGTFVSMVSFTRMYPCSSNTLRGFKKSVTGSAPI